MKILEILRKMINKERYNSESYVAYLRKKGMKIGVDTEIFYPKSVFIDESRPRLISIGDNVQITRGTTILTHGFDWSVLKQIYGEVLGSSGAVSIGNNVFIGNNAIILKGVNIGNNVIIGAGSVVTKDIPDNSVAVGNPCKKIMSIDNYYIKRKNAQIHEATELVQKYRDTYKEEPNNKALHEFFWIFSDDPYSLPKEFSNVQKIGGNKALCDENLKKNIKEYKNIHDFLNSLQ